MIFFKSTLDSEFTGSSGFIVKTNWIQCIFSLLIYPQKKLFTEIIQLSENKMKPWNI